MDGMKLVARLLPLRLQIPLFLRPFFAAQLHFAPVSLLVFQQPGLKPLAYATLLIERMPKPGLKLVIASETPAEFSPAGLTSRVNFELIHTRS
jgi:hypothetical protein